MAKILVGRDKEKEVEVGTALSRVASTVKTDVEEKEELAEEAIQDEQVVVAEEGDDAPAEKEETAPKRRGKKHSKA